MGAELSSVAPQMLMTAMMRCSMYRNALTTLLVRWPVRSWNEQAVKMAVTSASRLLHRSPAAPPSRNCPDNSIKCSAALRISNEARSVEITIASSSLVAVMIRLLSASAGCNAAISRRARSIDAAISISS